MSDVGTAFTHQVLGQTCDARTQTEYTKKSRKKATNAKIISVDNMNDRHGLITLDATLRIAECECIIEECKICANNPCKYSHREVAQIQQNATLTKLLYEKFIESLLGAV